ncbi:hypothetical protein J530_3094, partial [Acinetobacter baumannii 15827]
NLFICLNFDQTNKHALKCNKTPFLERFIQNGMIYRL